MFRALRPVCVCLLSLSFLVACQSILASAQRTPVPSPSDLEPFLEPEADNHPLISAISHSEKSIRLQTYLLTDREVIESLKMAQGRGVEVRVILEAQPKGAGAGNNPAVSELVNARVSVRFGNPAYNQTHADMLVVDDRTALIMALDQTRQAFKVNRGFGIVDIVPDDVAEIISAFEADWKRTPAIVSNQNLVWGPGSRQRLYEFIDRMNAALDIEVGELQDSEFSEHLIAAARRGTVVRLITSPVRNGTDENTPERNKIIAAGIQVRMLMSPPIVTQMMVADNVLGFMGSQAFSPESLDVNRELGIITSNRRIVEGLQATFTADWYVAK